MLSMDGIAFFKEACKSLSIPENLFLFKFSKNPQRFTFDYPKEKRQDNQLFAILYCEFHNIYIAWNLADYLPRCRYSVDKKDALSNTVGRIHEINKNIHFSGLNCGKGVEIVYTFTPNEVQRFLTEKVLERKEKCY